MRTVITHFFNEEYMLPWWLKHHLPMFDHGILINYQSTDRSVEICRELAPHWQLVDSFNSNFDALMCDFEVMHYERQREGWKIALNVSEFLACPAGIERLEKFIDGFPHVQLRGVKLAGVVMVDPDPASAPTYDRGLIEQKPFGFLEKTFNFSLTPWMSYPTRNRLYHKATIGGYLPGRHQTHLTDIGQVEDSAYVCWYGFSPYTRTFIDRKLSFKAKIPESDQKKGFGAQHLIGEEEINRRRQFLLQFTQNLRPVLCPKVMV